MQNKDKTISIPESAGSLISPDYIKVPVSATFKQVHKAIRQHIKLVGTFPSILAINRQGELIGILSILDLFAAAGRHINPYLKQPKIIHHHIDQEEILKHFNPKDRESFVVLNDDDSVMGVIKPRDLIKVVQEEATEDIYSFASVGEDENVLDSTWAKIRSRLKWIALYATFSFISAYIIAQFDTTISTLAILAAYMPIIAGVGGNAGMQTLAVITRGIALNQINGHNNWPIILRETSAALINGIAIGLFVAFIAYVFNSNTLLGLVIFLSITANILLSGLIGTSIPIILKRLKIDPAVSSASLLNATTDIFGFFIYLLLASIILI